MPCCFCFKKFNEIKIRVLYVKSNIVVLFPYFLMLKIKKQVVHHKK
jgi:hypothetical protein